MWGGREGGEATPSEATLWVFLPSCINSGAAAAYEAAPSFTDFSYRGVLFSIAALTDDASNAVCPEPATVTKPGLELQLELVSAGGGGGGAKGHPARCSG